MKFQPLVLIAIAASYANADFMNQLPSIQSRLAAYETILLSAYNSIQLDADGDITKAASGYAGLTTNGWYKSYISYKNSVVSDFATVTDDDYRTLFNTAQGTDKITKTGSDMGSSATDDAMDMTSTHDSRSRSRSGSRSASASGSKSSSNSESASAASGSSSSAAFGVAFLAPVGAVMGALALALM